MLYFGWSWVGILLEDNDYGQLGSQSLKKELLKSGVCIAFSETIPVRYSKWKILWIIDVIKKSSADIIIVVSTESNFIPLMEELSVQNITGKVWLAYHSWSDTPNVSKKQYVRSFMGTVGIGFHNRLIHGFQSFLLNIHPAAAVNNIFIKIFWEEAFGCKWPSFLSTNTSTLEKNGIVCTGDEKLEQSFQLFFTERNIRSTYYTYTAIYSAAHALHDLLTCKAGNGPFSNRTCANFQDIHPWQMFYYLRNVHFKISFGEGIFFDVNGDPPALSDIINWQLSDGGTLQYVIIGVLNSSASLGERVKLTEEVVWNEGFQKTPRSVCSESCLPGYHKSVRQGEPICCFDCIPCSKGEIANQTDSVECFKCGRDYWSNERQDTCLSKPIEFLSYEEPLGITLATLSISFSFITAWILVIFSIYRGTAIVKANNLELSYVLLSGLILCFLCTLAFIGYPGRTSCLLRQTAFGIIFALCVSCVLAKTITVIVAFNATKPDSKLRKWVGSKLPVSVILTCSLLQVMICTAWLLLSPPYPDENTSAKTGTKIIECNEGSSIAFWCMLGYVGVLASISFIVAFLARNLPDSFNETKFITFSMLVFVSVWLSFVPAYLSTRGKYMAAVEIFAILSSSAGLLACIFFPKCYIVLLRPEMNTKEYLMGKSKQT
ncbi:extracellular calcium-sensing receptor-like [Protopterus annectens]|uniref:extracellular calcium-sensing receptor-like n=1 Tax=Protopterus annectens TaxID=7888 RepID=UPI001CF989D6|nr:extracellular calcium-sensing receptor-like [Protopterus annectens]